MGNRQDLYGFNGSLTIDDEERKVAQQKPARLV